MSKTKKIISLLLTVALVMTMATVAIVSASAAGTVYFENTQGWATVNAYCYGGDGELLGSWPGTGCTDLGNNIWSVELSGSPEAVIFNSGIDGMDGQQTNNMAYEGGNKIAKTTGNMVQGDYWMVCEATWSDYTTDTPVEPGTTSAVVPGTTAAAPVVGDGMTVYFTNSNGWGAVNMYAYDANGTVGAEWPGSAMTFVETNGYGQDIYSAVVPAGVTAVVFNGGVDQPQTVDVTPTAGMGYYPDTQDAEGKWTVGEYVYEVPTTPTTAASQDETTAPVEPGTTAVVEPGTTAVVEPGTTAVVEPGTTAVVEPGTTAPVVTGTGITTGGKTYEVSVGDTVTYTYTLTTPANIENVQATTYYDATKLELVAGTAKEMFPVLRDMSSVIFNTGIPGEVKFNSTEGVDAGFDFTQGGTLVTLQFKVLDTAASEIETVLEEMVAFGGGDYVAGSVIVNDALVGVETLTGGTESTTAPVEPGTTAPVEPGTTAPVEPGTTAPVEPGTTAPVEPGTTAPVEPGTTAPVEPGTTAPVEPGTTAVVEPGTTAGTTPAPNTSDATGATGETGNGADNGAVQTGAAAYIYVVLAVLSMAACAVVVLRKRANG